MCYTSWLFMMFIILFYSRNNKYMSSAGGGINELLLKELVDIHVPLFRFWHNQYKLHSTCKHCIEVGKSFARKGNMDECLDSPLERQ